MVQLSFEVGSSVERVNWPEPVLAISIFPSSSFSFSLFSFFPLFPTWAHGHGGAHHLAPFAVVSGLLRSRVISFLSSPSSGSTKILATFQACT